MTHSQLVVHWDIRFRIPNKAALDSNVLDNRLIRINGLSVVDRKREQKRSIRMRREVNVIQYTAT